MIIGHHQSWFNRLLNSKSAMLAVITIFLVLALAIEWFAPTAGFLSLR